MKYNIGEYKEGYKKLFNSFRKRFGLDFGETLEVVDKVLEDEEYGTYPVIFISQDETYSGEFIEEINAKGEAQAFGFYKDGEWAYSNFSEIKENIPKVLYENEMDKFIFISVGYRSSFTLDIPGAICIKQGIIKGELFLTINKTRRIIPDEIIRDISSDDIEFFEELYNRLYTLKREMRPDLFSKGHKSYKNEFLLERTNVSEKNVIVCIKEGRLVGFLVFYTNYDAGEGVMSNRFVVTIKDMYVEEEYRRRGIATRMCQEVISRVEKYRGVKLNFMIWDADESTKKFITSLQPKALYTLYELDIQ